MSELDERLRGRTPSLIFLRKGAQCQASFEESVSGNLTVEFEASAPLHCESSASSLRFEREMTRDSMMNHFKDAGFDPSNSGELIFTDKYPHLKDQQSMQSILSDGTDSLIKLSSTSSLGTVKVPEENDITSSLGTVLVPEENDIVCQLRSYLKISQSLGPILVLKSEKRKNIFAAIRLYHQNRIIVDLSVNLLEMLAEKTEETAVFAEIMQNFGNLAALVSTHKSNLDFSLNFMKLVAHVLQKKDNAVSQLDDPAYKETFLQIHDQYVSNNEIQELFQVISDELGIRKRELTLIKSGTHSEKIIEVDYFSLKPRGSIIDRLPFTSQKLGLKAADSSIFGYGNWYSPITDIPSTDMRVQLPQLEESLSNNSETEAQSVDEWEDDDWINELDGDLVSWHSDDDDESSVKVLVSWGDSKDSNAIAGPKEPRIYTHHHLKLLQFQNAKREQRILEYKEELNKKDQEILKFHENLQTVKVDSSSVRNFMTKTENTSKCEIADLKRANTMLISAEKHLSKQLRILVASAEKVKAELNEKNKQIEDMKLKVSLQMKTAREHYIGVRQSVEAAKKEVGNLREKVEDTENKLAASRKEQEKKFQEHNNLHQMYLVKQNEFEKSRTLVTNLTTSYSSIKLDLSSKIAAINQDIAKRKNDIRLAHQMQGTFKANILKLKMERTTLQKNILAFHSMNSETDRIYNQLENLKKENTDLKERLSDLIYKVGGGDLKKLYVENEKLKTENTELKQMRDMLQGMQ